MAEAAPPDLAAIRAAAKRIEGRVVRTPCQHSETLSKLTGARVFLKFENQQFTSSFKERGAANKLLSLDPEQRRRGVIAASAGNHAQGVAYHASNLGIAATFVMPANTPTVKVTRVREFGGEVVLHGAKLADCWEILYKLAAERGLTPIHPYDDAEVIAGQGTTGLEMLEQAPEIDTIAVPLGGGGLISGIAIAAKALRPAIRIVGVQDEFYPFVAAATGRWNGPKPEGITIAEGIAVSNPGKLTLPAIERLVDDILVVREEDIEEAVALLLEIERTLCEGAGAAGLAALLAHPDRFRGRKVGLVLSGGNIDLRILMTILQRHLVRIGLLIRFRVLAPDVPGQLGRISAIVEKHGGNINDVRHERVFGTANPKAVAILFEVELRDPADREPLFASLTEAGFSVAGA